MTCYYYGPGEMELYRHALLRRSVYDAKMNVWYPGTWKCHRSRSYFRARFDIDLSALSLAFHDVDVDAKVVESVANDGCRLVAGGAGSRPGEGEGDDDDDDDDEEEGSDNVPLLEFRSNARIASAMMFNLVDYAVDEDSSSEKKGEVVVGCGGGGLREVDLAVVGRPLRWKSKYFHARDDGVSSSSLDDDGRGGYGEDVVYVHSVRIPTAISSRIHRYGGAARRCEVDDDPTYDGHRAISVAVVLELDTSYHRVREDVDVDVHATMDPPPPCIVVPTTSIVPSTMSWEWRGGIEDEWIAIDAYSCLSSSDVEHSHRGRKFDQRRVETHRPDDEVDVDDMDNDVDAKVETWNFPHEIDPCRISTVRPSRRLPTMGDDDVTFVEDEDDDRRADPFRMKNHERRLVAVYDFGREMLGKVRASISASDAPASSTMTSRRRPPSLAIRVGETHAEALNDDTNHFEQCIDVTYSLEAPDEGFRDYGGRGGEDRIDSDDDDVVNAVDDSERCPRHVWISSHILAFRYVRVIVDSRDGDDAPPSSNDVAVACLAHMPLLRVRGTFTCGDCGDGTDTSAKEERQSLDSRIWQVASYTLQLCTHQNFVVDGIKRDRLPWAGDLATSIAANAYSFCDEESIRCTLTVLGRCGLDNIVDVMRCDRNKVDESGAFDSVLTATKPDPHVNGMIDYSLWFIVSHWSYQKYFDDHPFLRREWNVIESRLRFLLKWCSDGETGWLIVNEDDRIFIDWIAENNAEKSTPLQILWWHALDCGISLAQKVCLMNEKAGEARNTRGIVSLLIDMQSRLERSYLRMDDIQFGRHAHVLGVVSGLFKRLDDRASVGDWSNPDSSDDRWHIVRRVRNLYDEARNALMDGTLPNITTPYFKYIEILALNALGDRPSALKVLRSYWGGMLDVNASTFFESFSEEETSVDIARFYDRPFGRSLCHAWASGPCALYPEILLGLRPLCDGWREWLCDPLNCVETVSTSIKTKYGFIHCHLDADYLRVSVPNGTSMILMGVRHTGGNHCFSRTSLISSQDTHEWAKKYRGWTHYPTHVIKSNPIIPGYEGIIMTDVPTIYQLPGDDLFYMSFVGFDGVKYQSFLAESIDLLNWTNMRLAMGCGEQGTFDFGGVVLGAYLYENYQIDSKRVLKKLNGKFYSLFGSYSKRGSYEPDPGYQGLASSRDGLLWEREKQTSILSIYGPGIVKDWEKDSIYQPWLVEHEGLYYNFYNAKEMPQWIEQIGLATSNDLHNWLRHEDNPVLRVNNVSDSITNGGFDTQFKSDAKVFWDEVVGHWVMFYFGVGKGGAHIMVAFSKDLLHWMSHSNPIYTAGANPSGLDKQHAHKISLIWNHLSETWFMFYCAVGDAGRGIGLIIQDSKS